MSRYVRKAPKVPISSSYNQNLNGTIEILQLFPRFERMTEGKYFIRIKLWIFFPIKLM